MACVTQGGYLPSGANGLDRKSRDCFEEVYSCNSDKQRPSTSLNKSVRFQGDATATSQLQGSSELPPDRPVTASEYCNSNTMGPVLQGNTGNNLGVSLAGFRSAKYTPQEWHNSNYARYYQAFLDRSTAERIRNESKKTAAETEATTNKTQDENTKKLGQRVHDINFWKVELEREIKDIIDETDRLLAQKKRLENALYTTEFPLHIATECLNNRQRRLGYDLVQDEVECALLKEIEIINNAQDLLRKTILESEKQIAANRQKKRELEFDWSDKMEAFEIDKRNQMLRNEDTNKQFYPGAATLAEKMSTPESWAQFSHDTICRAENERMASIQLRQLIENILEDTSRDMREQADTVERTLHKRIAEVEEAKQKLTDQLKKTVDELAAQERNIDMLKRAIRDKEAPLKVAQTRLHNRSFRPQVELCADPPQYGLINEVNEINNSIEQLLQKLKDAENSLQCLTEQRMALEKEIAVKKNSLMIDREKAANYRSRYPTTTRLLGYNH